MPDTSPYRVRGCRAPGKPPPLRNRPICSVSAGDRRPENHHHLSHRRLRRDSLQRCHYCDSGYTNHSLGCAASHCCVLLDPVRACRPYCDPSALVWTTNLFAHRSLARSAARGHSTYCLALMNFFVPLSPVNSNCRCPTSASCRSDRAGKHCRLYPHKRCRPWSQQTRRRLVRDERSFLPDLHA